MTNHTFDVHDDSLWSAAKAKAKMNGTTVTAVLTSSLRQYAAGEWNPPRDQPATLADVDALAARVAALEAKKR